MKRKVELTVNLQAIWQSYGRYYELEITLICS